MQLTYYRIVIDDPPTNVIGKKKKTTHVPDNSEWAVLYGRRQVP